MAQLDENEKNEIQEDFQIWLNEMKETPQKERTKYHQSYYSNPGGDGEDLEEKTIEYDETLPPVRRTLVFDCNSTSARRMGSDGEKAYRRHFVKPRDYREWDKLEKVWDEELAKEDPNQTSSSVTEKGQLMQSSETEVQSMSKLGLKDLEKRVRNLPESTKQHLATKEKDKGNEAFHAGDYGEALNYYNRSLAIHPTNAVYNNRALIYLHQKQWKSAVKDCSRILEEEPNNLKALYRRGRANYELHNLDEAEKDLERLTDEDPTNNKGQNLLRTVRIEKAKRQKPHIEGARRMVITDVGSSGSESSDSESDGDQESEEDGVELVPIKSATDKHTFVPKALTSQNTDPCCQDMSNHVTNSNLSDPVESKPTDQVDETNKPHDEEQKGAGEVINSKNHIDSSTPLVEIICSQKDTTHEEQRLKKTSTSSDDTTQGNSPKQSEVGYEASEEFNRLKEEGNRLFKLGYNEEAINYFTKCIELASNHGLSTNKLAVGYRNRALIYLRNQQYELAQQDCTTVLSIEPQCVIALYRRALALQNLKDYAGSLKDLEMAHQICPNNETITLELNKTQKLLSDYHSAEESDDTSDAEVLDVANSTSLDKSLENPKLDNTTMLKPTAESSIPNKTKDEWEIVPRMQEFSDIEYVECHKDKERLSMVEFNKRLITLQHLRNAHKNLKIKHAVELLNATEPEDLPKFIGLKLDASFLDDFIEAIEQIVIENETDHEFVYRILQNLSQTARFDCASLLMDDRNRQVVIQILRTLSNNPRIPEAEIAKLKQVYT